MNNTQDIDELGAGIEELPEEGIISEDGEIIN